MQPSAQRRVIVLGASNVSRGISTLVGTLAAVFDEPLEIHAAIGNGRGYRSTSRFLWRTLPSIERCGLWEAVEQAPAARTSAIVTDVGNDLAYGRHPAEIAAAVERCLDRLLAAGAEVVVCGLPVTNLDARSDRLLQIFRHISYPFSSVTAAEMRARAIELDARLEQLVTVRQLPLVRPAPGWYGLDPIHIRMRFWQDAWRRICTAWPEARQKEFPALAPAPMQWVRLNLAPAQRRRVLGVDRYRRQPAVAWRHGTSLSLY